MIVSPVLPHLPFLNSSRLSFAGIGDHEWRQLNYENGSSGEKLLFPETTRDTNNPEHSSRVHRQTLSRKEKALDKSREKVFTIFSTRFDHSPFACYDNKTDKLMVNILRASKYLKHLIYMKNKQKKKQSICINKIVDPYPFVNFCISTLKQQHVSQIVYINHPPSATVRAPR